MTTNKQSATSTQREKTEYTSLNEPKPWEPGVWKRLPVLGILSLLGVVLCIGFNVAILCTSDSQPTRKWDIQPSVLLAISSAMGNMLLQFAMTQGATITWWIKALQGCTVKDLHRQWSAANGLYESFRELRIFNVVTLASLASMVVSINNPLFQRASTVAVQPFENDINMSVAVVQKMPVGYTSIITGDPVLPNLSGMSTDFKNVVEEYTQRKPIYMNHTGCGTGKCSGTVNAAGLLVNCTKDVIPEDFGSQYTMASDNSVGGMQDVIKTTFVSNFTFDMYTNPPMNFTVSYKDQDPCKSRLVVNQCEMASATLKYPITIDDGVLTFSSSLSHLGVDPGTVADVYPLRMLGHTEASTLGGVYLAGKNLYTSQATIMQQDHLWSVNISGSLAQNYATHIDEQESCKDTWSDPTDEVINSLQEIMFRASVYAASHDDSQQRHALDIGNMSYNVQNQSIRTVQLISEPAFQTHAGYLAAGVVLMMVCVVVVASSFTGWWKLGRPASMSPVEIAKAFNAPLLDQGKASNYDLDALLGLVGKRPVRYGEVRRADETKTTAPSLSSDDSTSQVVGEEEEEEGGGGGGDYEHSVSNPVMLEMAHPDLAMPPRKGVKYE